NMVFRKGMHARVGGFRGYRYVHDWDFALRAARASSLLYLDRHVTIYRFHSANTISENPGGVAQEVRNLFANFAVDFPGQYSTEAFRAALEKNPFLRGSTTAQSDDPPSSNGGSSAHRSIRGGANFVAPLNRNGSAAMEVGICGTFDVANYGDLLFPALSENL